jgi:hypothetical protein
VHASALVLYAAGKSALAVEGTAAGALTGRADLLVVAKAGGWRHEQPRGPAATTHVTSLPLLHGSAPPSPSGSEVGRLALGCGAGDEAAEGGGCDAAPPGKGPHATTGSASSASSTCRPGSHTACA